MPYNAIGQPITQQEKLEQEYWDANHKRHIKIGTICFFALVALVFVAGIIGLCVFSFMLATSEDMTMRVTGIGFIVTIAAMLAASVAWARF